MSLLMECHEVYDNISIYISTKQNKHKQNKNNNYYAQYDD